MAIRRPSIYSPTWVYQDFLYMDNPPEQLRYLQVKWDGQVYQRISETFDYSNPPYPDIEQKGGDIVAQIDYTISGKLITINDWNVDWRDEWPLRQAVNYLINCLYMPEKGYVIRVRGKEVYNQAGEAIQVADKEPIAFWVSETFKPLDNAPNDYLVRFGAPDTPQPYAIKYQFAASVQTLVNGAQIVAVVQPFNLPAAETLFWEVVGDEVNAAYLLQGPTTGSVLIDEDPTYFNIPLTYPVPVVPQGPPYMLNINFYAEANRLVPVGSTTVEVPSLP
jgi:hypothetical protein